MALKLKLKQWMEPPQSTLCMTAFSSLTLVGHPFRLIYLLTMSYSMWWKHLRCGQDRKEWELASTLIKPFRMFLPVRVASRLCTLILPLPNY